MAFCQCLLLACAVEKYNWQSAGICDLKFPFICVRLNLSLVANTATEMSIL